MAGQERSVTVDGPTPWRRIALTSDGTGGNGKNASPKDLVKGQGKDRFMSTKQNPRNRVGVCGADVRSPPSDGDRPGIMTRRGGRRHHARAVLSRSNSRLPGLETISRLCRDGSQASGVRRVASYLRFDGDRRRLIRRAMVAVGATCVRSNRDRATPWLAAAIEEKYRPPTCQPRSLEVRWNPDREERNESERRCASATASFADHDHAILASETKARKLSRHGRCCWPASAP